MNVKNKTEMDKVVGVVSKLIMNVATLTLERQNLGGKNERIQKAVSSMIPKTALQ